MATRGKELLDSAKWNHRSDTSSDFLNDSNEQDADATKTKRRGGDKDVWDIDGEEERDDDASDTIRYRKACSSFNAGLKTAAAGLEIPFLFHLKTICRIFCCQCGNQVSKLRQTLERERLLYFYELEQMMTANRLFTIEPACVCVVKVIGAIAIVVDACTIARFLPIDIIHLTPFDFYPRHLPHPLSSAWPTIFHFTFFLYFSLVVQQLHFRNSRSVAVIDPSLATDWPGRQANGKNQWEKNYWWMLLHTIPTSSWWCSL